MLFAKPIRRETNYIKPNMANLRGKLGRSIIKTIKETPAPDRSALKRDVEAAMAKILAAKEKNEY